MSPSTQVLCRVINVLCIVPFLWRHGMCVARRLYPTSTDPAWVSGRIFWVVSQLILSSHPMVTIFLTDMFHIHLAWLTTEEHAWYLWPLCMSGHDWTLLGKRKAWLIEYSGTLFTVSLPTALDEWTTTCWTMDEERGQSPSHSKREQLLQSRFCSINK